MRGVSWQSQLAVGRVFELHSQSKIYPPPCALILDTDGKCGSRQVAGVDASGVIGHGLYRRRSNPAIYVDGLRGRRLTSRIARRRRDLERFDRDDIALIRYGCALDFDGRIETESIPVVVPAEWTVFWIPPYADGFPWITDEIRVLLRGAWHFSKHGGPKHLGYKFGHAWATRHTGSRLKQIGNASRRFQENVIEQTARVVQWSDENHVFTSELRSECPPLGSIWTSWQSRSGDLSGGFLR